MTISCTPWFPAFSMARSSSGIETFRTFKRKTFRRDKFLVNEFLEHDRVCQPRQNPQFALRASVAADSVFLPSVPEATCARLDRRCACIHANRAAIGVPEQIKNFRKAQRSSHEIVSQEKIRSMSAGVNP